MKRIAAALILSAAAAVPTPTLEAQQAGQQNPYVGRWHCEYAAYTVRNIAADNMTLTYLIDIMADGTYYAEGQMFASVVGYAEPLQSQGRWVINDEGIQAQGSFWASGFQYPMIFAGRHNGTAIVNNGVNSIARYSMLCERVQM